MNVNMLKLKNKDTKIILHSADTKLSFNHVNYWIPVLMRIDMPFSILVRDKKSYNTLVDEYPNLQIFYANTPVDVESVINAHSKIKLALYPSNMAKNIHLLRFIEIKHIFIGSKNSAQLSKFNKSYRAYDAFWSSSSYSIESIKNEIVNLGHLELKSVGKPQLYDICKNMNKDKNKDKVILIGSMKSPLINMIPLLLKETNYIYKIYIKDLSEILLQDLQSIISSSINRIEIFKDEKEFFLQSSDCSFILCDEKNLGVDLLTYNIPICMFHNKNKISMNDYMYLIADVSYQFSNFHSCMELINKISYQDNKKNDREKLLNFLLDVEATINNFFMDEIKASLELDVKKN